ncbi:CLAVATA3/ESR (CLE)-related protein ESR2-C precursor [Zea mays]|jgi:hypothetical protein|uniref:CLAVATA3/ESR (CLE)-related protein ESR1 n=2 Tax=Zea mays TaxID=4577 RepID=ESR1_MAIZE|nr:CLAVATA3/ESR (CLE)-related protein ESR2-C precursor [Zea mays]O24602.1 RecName: Full=CLAVATA3/ESR (CLE)-related protein ESR1; Short=ZmESR1; AltName: Full=Embryo surrounding region protein 1; Contains: RecName: Full=ESR1p; Flags: Precursor [Zea mays]ONL94061.1 embryo surrounding region1 [Zea mays]CAA67123.1 ESR1g1 [Zea mays]CAA68230.1 ESR1g2 [Zea mays]|eukprot:NP_001105956.1 embryo surrounding region 1 precursor [Zea mays]
MASRMGMVAIVSLFVCALAASTSVNANVWQTDDIPVVNSNMVRHSNMERQQQQGGFIGHRPRLASFNRASNQDGDRKRTVPSGPDHMHHSIPSHTPQHPPVYVQALYEDDRSRTSSGPSKSIGPPPLSDRY